MQRNSRPIDWRIRGVSDALDASMAFRGSMQVLQNLIPDVSTRGIWTCRPASTPLINFNMAPHSGHFIVLSSPSPYSVMGGSTSSLAVGATFGNVSVIKISGNVLYGMVGQTSGTLAGYDVPFAFNLSTNTVIAVTGTQTTSTLPLSQPMTGAWTPPQMDLIGVKMMVAHPGFGAAGNYVGWFDITTPTAPVWNAGQLTGGFVTFTTPPIAVKQFFNRAYYIHNAVGAPAVIFSDALNATNVTNANQVLTFGDNTPLTALGALPLTNQLGGIIQSLMVFKNTSNIYQISGDAGLGNLYVNALNVATGTLAPNSIASTPKGLVFMAPDGMRLIDFTGTVQDPIGYEGQGVTVPFVYTAQPTRVDAACNGNVLRISTQNGLIPVQPQQDWWYDFAKGIWSGPHTFPAALAVPYQQTFIISPIALPSSIWQSNFIQYQSSLFTENGVAMTWAAQTSLLPDTDLLTNNTITESSVDMAMQPTQGAVQISFNNQNNSPISSVAISPIVGAAPGTWGSSTWGGFIWGGGSAVALAPYQIPWTLPITFVRGSMAVNGNSVLNFKLGTIHMRYQPQRSLVNVGLAA